MVRSTARDGMTTFSDIAGRLEMLRVECEKCGRKGQYRVMRPMKELGPEATVGSFVEMITNDCGRLLGDRRCTRSAFKLARGHCHRRRIS
jgi:hypothetical protein